MSLIMPPQNRQLEQKQQAAQRPIRQKPAEAALCQNRVHQQLGEWCVGRLLTENIVLFSTSYHVSSSINGEMGCGF